MGANKGIAVAAFLLFLLIGFSMCRGEKLRGIKATEDERKTQLLIASFFRTLASLAMSLPRAVVGLISSIATFLLDILFNALVFLGSSTVITTATTTTRTTSTSLPMPVTTVPISMTSIPTTPASMQTFPNGPSTPTSSKSTTASSSTGLAPFTSSTGATSTVTVTAPTSSTGATATSAATTSSTGVTIPTRTSLSSPTTATGPTSTTTSSLTSTTSGSTSTTTSSLTSTTTSSTASTTMMPALVSKIVFVTSEDFGSNLGGIEGADGKCGERAMAANLTGTFLAWLSNETVSPLTRFQQNAGPYIRTDNTTFANSFASLVGGIPLAPLNFDENGDEVSDSVVWTNTNNDGNLAGVNHCINWNFVAGFCSATVGNNFDAATWSRTSSTSLCLESLPIYCFEQ